MNVATPQLLFELIRRGVELAPVGLDQLRYRPVDALDDNLRAALVARKQELLPIVRLMCLPPLPAGLWARCASALLSAFSNPEVRADLRELFEEQAAIFEYDGILSRDEAERLSFLQLREASAWQANRSGETQGTARTGNVK